MIQKRLDVSSDYDQDASPTSQKVTHHHSRMTIIISEEPGTSTRNIARDRRHISVGRQHRLPTSCTTVPLNLSSRWCTRPITVQAYSPIRYQKTILIGNGQLCPAATCQQLIWRNFCSHGWSTHGCPFCIFDASQVAYWLI